MPGLTYYMMHHARECADDPLYVAVLIVILIILIAMLIWAIWISRDIWKD